MVTKISFPKRASAALNYNERKVQQGQALFLAAVGYLREAPEMNFYHKLAGLEQRNSLNCRAATRTMHISINFDPSENLPTQKLIAITQGYMERLGFGGQPYLVYRHLDAGHPHLHIVTTTIRTDGTRINTHNIGRDASEKARKELEVLYSLVKAEVRKEKKQLVRPLPVEKLSYGSSPTKEAIERVVAEVFGHYSFTSLPEYNAALRPFHVAADRGKEGSRTYGNGGLVYRVLDSSGNKVGVPIKGSALYGQPTLKNLERKFLVHKGNRDQYKQRLIERIEKSVHRATTMDDLVRCLQREQVYTLLRQSESGLVYGVTFVDNTCKCVFNGSDLGKGYSAAALQSQIANKPAERALSNEVERGLATASENQVVAPAKDGERISLQTAIQLLLHPLFSVEEQYTNPPFQLLAKKRKRKKRKDNY